VADAQRHGVVVERPNVQTSAADASLAGDRDAPVVRLGLTTVRGISRDLATRIAEGAPWRDSEDLVRRAGCQQQHLEALAAAGALDCFSTKRREMVWVAGAAAQSTTDRLEGVVTGATAPALAPPTALERVADDLWAMGLTPDATTMALLRPLLRQRGVVAAAGLVSVESPRVTVGGVVTHRQHPETARGAVFLNIEDETGHVNVVFSKGAWARWGSVARSSPALLIRGSLQRGQGTMSLTAEFVEPLALGATVPSRDWR
jgi:error-prone DNA polymerase